MRFPCPVVIRGCMNNRAPERDETNRLVELEKVEEVGGHEPPVRTQRLFMLFAFAYKRYGGRKLVV